MQHPNMYFTKEDINSFKIKMNNDEYLKKKYQEAIENVEELLKEDFVTEDFANGNDSLHGCFWDLSAQTNKMIQCLGTKWAIEGDIRCAKKLRDLIAHFTEYEKWYAESYKNRTPVPWHSDLCSTRMTLAISTVYDLIYDYLSDEEKNIFAQKILELGVKPGLSDWALPESRIHAVDSMGHNWWAVCIAESAAGLIPLKDHISEEEYNEMLTAANEALCAYFTYSGNTLFNKHGNYDKNGFFYESIGYFNYGTGTPLLYLWIYERYFGRNEKLRASIPEKLAYALMSFSYPYIKEGKEKFGFLDFGDSDFDATCTFLSKMLILNGMDSESVRACCSKEEPELWDLIQGFEIPEPKGCDKMPLTSYFQSGYVMTRDSWKPNSTVFAVKSGFCWNHSHNDAGHFTIFKNGRPFIIDSGRCNYDNRLYHPYYCQDEAHNVIRIGGKGARHEELYRGTKFSAKINEYFEEKNFLYIQADTTGPLCHLASRAYRNFFWFDSSLLLIFDDIYTHEEDKVDFLLHYEGELKECGKSYLIKDNENNAELINHIPSNMISSYPIGYKDQKPDSPAPYLQLTTEKADRKHLLVTSLELDKAVHNTVFEKLTGNNCEGLRFTRSGKTFELWYNHMADGHIMHDNSNNVIAGFDTDAYMLILEKGQNDAIESIFAVCSSYVRKDGKVLQSSFVKETKMI